MWINTNDRLPPINIMVGVAGDYTPLQPYPTAALRRQPDGHIGWSSDQWRGQTAIRWWWEDEEKDEDE